MKKSKSTRATKQLKCTQGNYQCGGRCMSTTMKCRTETHKPEVNKSLNSAVVQIESGLNKTKRKPEKKPKQTDTKYETNLRTLREKAKQVNPVEPKVKPKQVQEVTEPVQKSARQLKEERMLTYSQPRANEWSKHESPLNKFAQFNEMEMTDDEVKQVHPELHSIMSDLGISTKFRKMSNVKSDYGLDKSNGFYDTTNEAIYLQTDRQGRFNSRDIQTTMLHEFVHVLQHELDAKSSNKVRGMLFSEDVYKNQSPALAKTIAYVNKAYNGEGKDQLRAEYEAFFIASNPSLLKNAMPNIKKMLEEARAKS